MSTSDRGDAARVQGVSKLYRSASGEVVALDDVSAAFAFGSLSVVAGPSGSGKSTLLRLLAGLDHPDDGELEVAGVRLHPARAGTARRLRRGVIGYLFQRPSDNFVPHLTVGEHLRMAMRRSGREADAAAVADRLGIADRVDHLPSQLSGGEQQRAAIAQVLLSGSTVVLADEPTANLDTASSERLLEVLRPFAAEGLGFIVASHDPLVRGAADDVLDLDHGRATASPHRSAWGAAVSPGRGGRSGRGSAPLATPPLPIPEPRVNQRDDMPADRRGAAPQDSPGLRWTRGLSERRFGPPQAGSSGTAPPVEPGKPVAAKPRRKSERPPRQDDEVAAVVEVERVSKSYRRGNEVVHAVREVSFVARPGEFVGLFGRSGSGKTTLLNLVAGWERPDEGRAVLAGVGTRSWAEVSVMPQKLGLFDELTVRGNIEYPARLAGRLEQTRDVVDELVEALGLTDLQDRHPRETSVGEQQRTALARALVLAPRLVLADEPTGHQDHDSGRAVFRALERATLEGTTCIAATHNEEILPYLDRVLAMSDGRLDDERDQG